MLLLYLRNGIQNANQTACADFPPGCTQWYRLLLCAARPTMHCQWDNSAICFFCPWWPWPLTLTFELRRDFCTLYLTAKFDRPMFSRSEVIVRTNKQTNTPLKTSTSLRYATPVGKYVFIAEEIRSWLSVTLVGGENGDAVCSWNGDSQEHISPAMSTIIRILHFPFFKYNKSIIGFIMVALCNRADHYIFAL